MTFDDGPSRYTPRLLDMLNAEDMKATFFVIGNNDGKENVGSPENSHFEILRRMVREGHQVAQHTWTHENLDIIGHDQRKNQLLYNEAALVSALGVIPTYMRPPYLVCGAECLEHIGRMGYHVVWNDVDTFDWRGDYNASLWIIYNSIGRSEAVTHSFMPLQHDIHEKTVDVLVPYMIELIKQQGYRTVTVGECLRDPPENWYRNATTGLPQLPFILGDMKHAGEAKVEVKEPKVDSHQKWQDKQVRPGTASHSNPRPRTFVPLSSNGLCGRAINQTCTGSVFGNCCGHWGQCGSTPEHCKTTTCQGEFGLCEDITASLPLTMVHASHPTQFPAVTNITETHQPVDIPPHHEATLTPSPDGTCGPSTSFTCTSSLFGPCCSSFGWCGISTNHCLSQPGCQPNFGACPVNEDEYHRFVGEFEHSMKGWDENLKVTKDGRCGPESGDMTCKNGLFGQCCSKWGWCGQSADHCEVGMGCLGREFGMCW
jgi:peptidoglycan/xylan/chitin deacetylase (PgdA/CDA1 family)